MDLPSPSTALLRNRRGKRLPSIAGIMSPPGPREKRRIRRQSPLAPQSFKPLQGSNERRNLRALMICSRESNQRDVQCPKLSHSFEGNPRVLIGGSCVSTPVIKSDLRPGRGLPVVHIIMSKFFKKWKAVGLLLHLL